jgi:hypothetical protein
MIEITEELEIFLVGKLYTERSYFNPVQMDLLWYISTQEIEFCTNEEIKPLLPKL